MPVRMLDGVLVFRFWAEEDVEDVEDLDQQHVGSHPEQAQKIFWHATVSCETRASSNSGAPVHSDAILMMISCFVRARKSR